jgi:hypothetical protein
MISTIPDLNWLKTIMEFVMFFPNVKFVNYFPPMKVSDDIAPEHG